MKKNEKDILLVAPHQFVKKTISKLQNNKNLSQLGEKYLTDSQQRILKLDRGAKGGAEADRWSVSMK